MNLSDTLHMLVRRWYILVPGLVLALVLASLAFVTGKVEYERSASMLLLPAEKSIPEGANPFLYISGLGQTADVLVRAVGAPAVVEGVVDTHPGVEIVVQRDPTTASPLLVVAVTSHDDEEAALALDVMIDSTHEILAQLQSDEDIVPADQVTVIPLTKDQEGVASQKARILAAGMVAVGLTVLTLLVTALTEAFSGLRRRRATSAGTPAEPSAPAKTRARARARSSESSATPAGSSEAPAPEEPPAAAETAAPPTRSAIDPSAVRWEAVRK